MFVRFAILATLMVGVGCSRDYELNQDADNVAAPAMRVDPHQLVFSDVSTGDTVTQSFSISNVGSARLDISDISISGASAFSVLTTLPQSIDPDDVLDVEIAYSPLNTEDAASALISSSDPDLPQDVVELLGDWAAPLLQIDPSDADFGDLVIDCTDTLSLTLSNVGDGDLVIDQILHTGEGFEISQGPDLPVSLPPDQSTTVVISFAPEEARDYSGTLWVDSNDPAGRRQASQQGAGDADGICVTVNEGDTETISVDMDVEYQVADVSFVIDTTASMGTLANAVAGEFSTISTTLAGDIPDITFGVASYEDYNSGNMGYSQDRPFRLLQQQTSSFTTVQAALSSEVTIHDGADTPESTMEALYQAATGAGYDQDCDGGFDMSTDVAPFMASASDVFGGTATGSYDAGTLDGGQVGGFGYRENVLPIIIFATDAELRDPDTGYAAPGGCPMDAGSRDVVSAMNSIGARVIGVGVSMHESSDAFAQIRSLAENTGSYGDMDGDGRSEPAAITWSGASAQFRDKVIGAVEGLVGDAHFDLVRLDVVSDEHGMVRSISPESWTDVDAGTEVSFDIEFYGAVAAEASARTVEVDLQLIGVFDDKDVLLDTLTVFVMVPEG